MTGLRLGLGWGELLARWDADWHQHAPGAAADPLPLGAAPATEADVATAEARLGVRFPPSYRQFLAVSDGWRRTGTWVAGLRPVREVGWFRDLEREWYEIWYEGTPDLPDVALMARAIVVSAPGEEALLLDPAAVDPATGEWHCRTFSNKHPGAAAGSMSFRDEVEDLYLSFVRFDVPAGDTRAELARRAADAVRGVLAGEPAALDDLALVAPYDWAAGCARAQIDLLRNVSLIAIPQLWSGEPTMPAERALADPVVLREIVPAGVANAHERDHDLTYELRRTPEPALSALRAAIDTLGSGAGLVAEFSYAPGFAAAVDAARALVPDDEEGAWRTIVGALPEWRPLAPHHVVPLGLRYDSELSRLLTTERVAELLAVPRPSVP